MATTTEVGQSWVKKSQQAHPSKKVRKPQGRLFGPKSQFAGVGRGVPGDPRK